MPEWWKFVIVGLVIVIIILSIIIGILLMVPPPALRPTTLLLMPVNDVVEASSFTVSGKLVDLTSGEIIGQPITFTGSAASVLPSSVMTSSIKITDPKGIQVVNCPVPTCTPDPGFSGGNRVLHLGVNSTIELPPTGISNPQGIREVRMTIQDMGNTPFTVTVTQVGGVTTFTNSSAGNSMDLVYFSIISPVGIKKIEITSIGASGGMTGSPTVGISMIRTIDPASNPALIHTLNFEDLAEGTYNSPLLLDAGSFFAIGDAPAISSLSTDNLTVQAHFAGNAMYEAAESIVQSFSLMNSTLGLGGTLGETNAVITGDTGRGVTTIDCSLNDPDTDLDGICDDWERNGVPFLDGSGGRYNLCLDPAGPSGCPDANRKDIYVEIDYMPFHEPSDTVLNNITDAFYHAPITNPPTVEPGIGLHIKKDEQLSQHLDVIRAWTDPSTAIDSIENDFDQIKIGHFGTVSERADPNHVQLLRAKAQVYHYSLFVHTIGLNPTDCGPSGLAETPGNDFIVSLGCNFDGLAPAGTGHDDPNPADNLAYTIGTTEQQEGTFMHELGHNLGLHHGGPLMDGTTAVPSGQYTNNCKPDYASVMSYSRQFPTFFTSANKNWKADYSSQALTPRLNESSLSEPQGLRGPTIQNILYSTPNLVPKVRFGSTNGAIDWNGDGTPDNTSSSMNINDFNVKNCNSDTMTSNMKSYDDWHNLQLNFRSGNGGEIDGVYPDPNAEPPEINGEIVQKMTLESQACPAIPKIEANAGDNITMGFTFTMNANITMHIVQVVNGTVGPDMDPVTNSTTDTLYNTVGNGYAIEWDTTGLGPGTWAIRLYNFYGSPQQSLLDCDGDRMSIKVELT